MGITGDWGDLDSLIDGLRRIQDDANRSGLAESLAHSLIDGAHQCFADSADPYGRPWAPLVIRDGKPLLDSGQLRNSIHAAEASAVKIRIASNAVYSDHVALGTGIYGPTRQPIRPRDAKALRIPGVGLRASVKGSPPRPFFPSDARGLPPMWRSELEEAVIEWLEEQLPDPT